MFRGLGWLCLSTTGNLGYARQDLAPSSFCAPIYLCRTHHVLEVQQLLARKGYYRAALDGIYGEATWAATLKFQQEYTKSQGATNGSTSGLLIDGIAGPQTLAALHNLSPQTLAHTDQVGNQSSADQLSDDLNDDLQDESTTVPDASPVAKPIPLKPKANSSPKQPTPQNQSPVKKQTKPPNSPTQKNDTSAHLPRRLP